jgi:hypothetical protein
MFVGLSTVSEDSAGTAFRFCMGCGGVIGMTAEESHGVFLGRNKFFHHAESSWLIPELENPMRPRNTRIVVFDSLA